jgi:K+-transporting ATPase ATPase A chain
VTWQGWFVIVLLIAVVAAVTRPLGGYIARIAEGRLAVPRGLAALENGIYRLAGVNPTREQSWAGYALSLLCFHFVGIVLLYGLQRLQHLLPFNPQELDAVGPDLALNTAISFATNTSWQSYAGETTLSYLSQMAGITVQSFLSGATGIAVAFALLRGVARASARTVGNFWVDLTRITLYLLLPICAVACVVLVSQGVPQTLDAYVEATALEGGRQLLAYGPVASQEAIKLLSGDGGGFFNTNSAHPFENPTALTSFFELLLIFMIGAALTNTFGRMVRDERQGWALFAAMAVLFLAGVTVVYGGEITGNPAFSALGIDQATGSAQAGGNMEGKEVRFGPAQSALFSMVSTSSSDGAVNAMHDSFMPLSGAVLMANMKIGEIIFGGPGSGLFGMLLFVIVAVFVAGLMVGRTPEYLGKKIEADEIKMAMLAMLVTPALILGGVAIAVVLPVGLSGPAQAGSHGFSEILYAYTSAAATNGSAFAGLSANSPYYNLTLAAAMFGGRFLVIVPVLCIAGTLAAKRRVPASAGTLTTHGPLFIALLLGTIVVLGGLTFFPALVVGPVAEHLMMHGEVAFWR